MGNSEQKLGNFYIERAYVHSLGIFTYIWNINSSETYVMEVLEALEFSKGNTVI
jgi:hypothetical protein